MTQIGSIYVEVRGDSTQFQKDMTALRGVARKSGKEVSDALNNAIKPGQASKGISDISINLHQLAKAAKVPEGQFKITAKAISDGMSDVAKQVGLTNKEFANLNERMLRTQAMRQSESSLRNIARSAGLSQKEIKALAVQMGFSSSEATRFANNISRAKTDTDGLRRSSETLTGTLRSLYAAASVYLSARVLSSGVKSAISEFVQFERQQLRLEAQIRATGRTSQITSKELIQMSREIGRATLASQQGVREAQGILMSFLSVSTQDMERILYVAQDVAEVMGGDIVAATKQMAVALEDPISGLGRLTRTGTTFTKEQKELIKSLAETGRMAEAQHEILKVMESQYGGTGKAAAQGLGGAIDTLGEALTDLRVEIGSRLAPQTTEYVTGLTDWIDKNQALIGQKIDDYLVEIVKAGRGVAPVFRDIGAGIKTVVDGYLELPDILKTIGIVGVLVGGKVGFAVVGSISLVIGQLRKLTDEINNVDVSTKMEAILKMQEAKLSSLQKQYDNLKGSEKEVFGDRLKNQIVETTAYIEELRVGIVKAQNAFGDWHDSVRAQLKSYAVEIKKAPPAPSPVPDKVDQKMIDKYNNSLASIKDEWAKLTLTAKEYESLKIHEWYAKEKAIVGQTVPELEKLLNVKLALLDAEEGLTDQFLLREQGMEAAAARAQQIFDDRIRDRIEGEAKAAEEIAREKIRAEEKAAAEIERIYDQALRDIQSNNADVIRGMLDGNLKKWENYGDAIVDVMKNTFAQIVAMALQQKVILPVFVGFLGGAMGNVMGGGMGGGNLPVSLPTGLFSPTGSMGMGIHPFFGQASFGSTLGAAGLGSLGYSTLGNLIGLSQGGYSGIGSFIGSGVGYLGGSAIGSAIGAAGGSIIPGIGTIIGSALGGLVGSLFGGKKQPPKHRTSSVWDLSGVSYKGIGGGATTEDAERLAGPIFGAVETAQKMLKNLGGAVDDFSMTVNTSFRRVARVYLDGKKFEAKKFEDLPWDEITALAFKKMIQAAEFQSKEVERAIGKVDFSSLENAVNDLNFIMGYDDAMRSFKSGIEEMKVAMENAAKNEVALLIENLDKFRDSAEKLGYDLSAVDEAHKDYVTGLVLGREAMSQSEAQIYALNAKFKEYEKALERVGYSAAEAAKIAAEGLEKALKDFDDQYRASFESSRAQFFGESSVEAYWESMGVTVDKIFGGVDQMMERLASITPAEFEALAKKFGMLPSQLWELAEAMKPLGKTAKEVEESFTRLHQTLRETRAGLFGEYGDATNQYGMSKAMMEGLASKAMQGDLEAFEALSKSVTDFVGMSKDYHADFGAYQKDFLYALRILGKAEKYAEGQIPGYASGGSFSPGLAMVGERGPELVRFRGRGRVYSNNELGEIVSELRDLKSVVASYGLSIARHTENTSSKLNRWEIGGIPPERT